MPSRIVLPVAAVFVLTLVVYLLTMPRVITLEDASLFQMVCHKGGIGHPPGYPLFILGCQAFVNLPFFGDDVIAGNLLSATYASLACGVVYLLSLELGLSRPAGLVTAMGYGLSATFWSQAIIIEVYSMAALMFALCLLFALRYRARGAFQDLWLLALCFSLALSNHWPLQGLASPALLLVILPRWRDMLEALLTVRHLLVLMLVSILGLLPYLSLFQPDPEIAVFGGVHSPGELIRYVARSAYTDQSPIAGWDDRWHYQVWVWAESARELSWILFPLVLLGLFVSFKRLPLSTAVGLVLLYLGATTGLILMLGFEFNGFRQAIFKPYPVIAYLSVAIWLGFGVGELLRAPLPAWSRRVIPIVAVLVPLLTNLGQNLRSGPSLAENYGRLVLASVPQGSVLFAEGDNGAGLLGYLHQVAGARPDLELRSWFNLVFSNRLASPFAPDEVQEAAIERFLTENDRPIYMTMRQDRPVINHGLVLELSDADGFACDGSNHALITQLVALDLSGLLTDAHEKELLLGVLMDLTRQHLGLVLHGAAVNDDEVEVLNKLQETFAGKLASLEKLVTGRNPVKPVLLEMAVGASRQMPADMRAQVQAVLEEYHGRIALMEPSNPELAIQHFNRSLDLYPSARNASACELERLLDEPGRAEIVTRIGEPDCDE